LPILNGPSKSVDMGKGDTHWTPNGGHVAECGERAEGMLKVAAMVGVNCPECSALVRASIDSIRPIVLEQRMVSGQFTTTRES
jgi:hypothetical protein